MGYGYRNAGLDITLDPANVSRAADSAAGTIAHGPLPPALSDAVAQGLARGSRGLVTLGWVALLVVVVVNAEKRGALGRLLK